MDVPAVVDTHPLNGIELKVKNFKCFGDEPTGFDELLPINIIIGRNNSGKSALADAIDCCIKRAEGFDNTTFGRSGQPFELFIGQNLDEQTLQQIFRREVSGGNIPGSNHWTYRSRFVGDRIRRSLGHNRRLLIQDGPTFRDIRGPGQQSIAKRSIRALRGRSLT